MASNTEEEKRLLEEINRLQQEKRSLGLRVQGVEVLAKVLQDSHDENSKLKQEVQELRGELKGTSLDVTPSRLSLQTTPSMMENRCFLSQQDENSISLSESSYECVNFQLNPSFETGPSTMSGTPPHDLHMRELSSGFKTIKNESDILLKQAKDLLDLTRSVVDKSENADLTQKVSTLLNRIGNHAKDMKTRETLLNGLACEEDQLKEKAMVLEMEQVTQEQVMVDIKLQMKDDKEALEGIREQIQLSCESVFVNKEDVRSLDNFSYSETASNTSQMSSQSKVNDKEELETPHSCGQCSELLQQLNQSRKENQEVMRQKEEILDVNHAWDTQYKKLKTETGKEIADLKQQVGLFKTSDAWAAATGMIEQEKQNALKERTKLENKCEQLQEEVYKLSIQIRSQQQAKCSLLQQTPSPSPKLGQSGALNEQPPKGMVKEIEVLKQQLRVYADDFACERQDRERMQSEKETLEIELSHLKEEVTILKQQVHLYEEDFRKESQEKDSLRRQLNLQREGSEPGTRLNEMTRKAQAVAERQARLRALRDQYNREERHLLQDEQELQQSARVMAIRPESQQNQLHDLYQSRSWAQRQNIHPRGATDTQRPSNDMFHGGEVQADSRNLGREVVDSTNDKHHCPRCFRQFLQDDQESFQKHKIKCIE